MIRKCAEEYIINSRNSSYLKQHKRSHLIHYRDDIRKLTENAFCQFSNKKLVELGKINKNYLKTPKIFDILSHRKSVRSYSKDPLKLDELSTYLYYLAGKREDGKRMVPSGGNLNSNSIYFYSLNVKSLNNGFYYYNFLNHDLVLINEKDYKDEIKNKILYQPEFADAAIVLVLIANYSRISYKYGKRALRIVHMDAGVILQNAYIVGEAMNLASCACGGVIENEVEKILDIDGIDNFVVVTHVVGKKGDD